MTETKRLKIYAASKEQMEAFITAQSVDVLKGANPMKTKEELNALKEEVETLNKKLAELDEDELKLVVGGSSIPGLEAIGPCIYLGRENSNPEKSCHNGSIQEVIGPWDIQVKSK